MFSLVGRGGREALARGEKIVKWLFVAEEPVAVMTDNCGVRCPVGNDGDFIYVGTGRPIFKF